MYNLSAASCAAVTIALLCPGALQGVAQHLAKGQSYTLRARLWHCDAPSRTSTGHPTVGSHLFLHFFRLQAGRSSQGGVRSHRVLLPHGCARVRGTTRAQRIPHWQLRLHSRSGCLESSAQTLTIQTHWMGNDRQLLAVGLFMNSVRARGLLVATLRAEETHG